MRWHGIPVYLVLFLIVGCNALSSSTNVLTTAPTKSSSIPTLGDFDYLTSTRLPWSEEGYMQWKWRGHDINYIEMGDESKPAILLIHGFGASSYHFRHNIPILARDFHVYAFDLLGFGLSSKPVQDYSAEVWRDQAADFITEVIRKPTTIAGNSLGGFTALYTSATETVQPLVTGCILLNAAGRFKDPNAVRDPQEKNVFLEKVLAAFQRFVIALSFIYTKQPARIQQVLKQVYPVKSEMVDDELVESIRYPSLDANAAEVFYRVIVKNGGGPSVFIDDLLDKIDCPLLLCWGEEDPWIRSTAADKIQALHPQSTRVSIDAGHCPHDEDPEAVNSAVLQFMESIKS